MSQRHFICLVAACVFFVFIYSPIPLYFLSDDWDSLLFSLQPAHLLHSFRPLSDLSLYLDYSVWKMNAAGFHLTNLMLHFSCVFCCYFFSKKLFHLRNNVALSRNLALVCSLIFLFYPYHSEALFWIVGRGAVLCTLFGLLSFIFYMKINEGWFYYSLSLLCFAASLLSYEQAWIIPVVVILLSVFCLKQKWQTALLHSSGFGLFFILYLIGRWHFTQDIIGTPYGSQRITGFTFFLLCKNFAALILRSVVAPMQSSFWFVVTCAIAAFTLLSILLILRKKLNLIVGISVLCFAVMLLPVVPLGIDTHDTESERFLYFPSVFLLLFLVQLFGILLKKKLWLVCLVILGEIIVLQQSYHSFVISSVINAATARMLVQTGFTDTLFCQSLPSQYKGAFIFRNGIESAVKLLKKDSVQHVVVLSRGELFNPEKTYKASYINLHPENSKRNLQIEWQEDKVVFRR